VSRVDEDVAALGDGSAGQRISLREPACHWQEQEADAEHPGDQAEQDLRSVAVSVGVAHGRDRSDCS